MHHGPQPVGQADRKNFLGQMGQAELLKELLGFCWGAQSQLCVRLWQLWQLSATTGRAPLNGRECLISAQGKAEKDFSIL